MSKVTDFAAAVQVAFTDVTTALDNIAADEANLAKQIQDLKDQLAAAGLSPADQAALDAVLTAATAMSVKTKSIADAVPDLPAPPPGV